MLKSQPRGSNPSLGAQIPALGSNPSLKAQISTPRLKFQPQGQIPASELKIPASQTQSSRSPPVFYRTSSPLGPLPCLPSPTIINIQSRATGIADHILHLGDWFFFFFFFSYSSAFLPPGSNPSLETSNLASRPQS